MALLLGPAMRRYDAKEIVTFLNAPGGASALLGTVPQNLKGIRPMLALCKGLERYGQQNGDVYSDLAQANGAVVLAEVLHAHYRSTMVVNPALCLLRCGCLALPAPFHTHDPQLLSGIIRGMGFPRTLVVWHLASGRPHNGCRGRAFAARATCSRPVRRR